VRAEAKGQLAATTCSNDSREKSEVDALADRFPMKTRNPSRFSRALVKRSTAESRTWTSKVSPSATTTSASVAPRFLARFKRSAANSERWVSVAIFSPLSLCPADGDLIDLDGRHSNSDGDRLTILPARPYTLIQFQVVTYHRDAGQNFRPISDQRGPFHGPSHLAVLNQIGFAGGEDEFSIGDIDLPAAERQRVQPFFHGAQYIVGVRFTGQHERIGHARQGNTLKIFAPAIAR